MQLFSADFTIFKKEKGWAVFSTANKPKYKILFHKNGSPRDLLLSTE